jgi:hypothetical protein
LLLVFSIEEFIGGITIPIAKTTKGKGARAARIQRNKTVLQYFDSVSLYYSQSQFVRPHCKFTYYRYASNKELLLLLLVYNLPV